MGPKKASSPGASGVANDQVPRTIAYQIDGKSLVKVILALFMLFTFPRLLRRSVPPKELDGFSFGFVDCSSHLSLALRNGHPDENIDVGLYAYPSPRDPVPLVRPGVGIVLDENPSESHCRRVTIPITHREYVAAKAALQQTTQKERIRYSVFGDLFGLPGNCVDFVRSVWRSMGRYEDFLDHASFRERSIIGLGSQHKFKGRLIYARIAMFWANMRARPGLDGVLVAAFQMCHDFWYALYLLATTKD